MSCLSLGGLFLLRGAGLVADDEGRFSLSEISANRTRRKAWQGLSFDVGRKDATALLDALYRTDTLKASADDLCSNGLAERLDRDVYRLTPSGFEAWGHEYATPASARATSQYFARMRADAADRPKARDRGRGQEVTKRVRSRVIVNDYRANGRAGDVRDALTLSLESLPTLEELLCADGLKVTRRVEDGQGSRIGKVVISPTSFDETGNIKALRFDIRD